MRNHLLQWTCLAIGAAAIAAPAEAANVTFSGTVANLCVLTITTPGALALSSNGTALSSDEVGGVASVLAVAATGTNPTISLTAPQLTGPAASLSGATKELSFSSPGGGAQAWTAAGSTYTANRLIDTMTIKARATNSAGFVTGSYAINATATCQQ